MPGKTLSWWPSNTRITSCRTATPASRRCSRRWRSCAPTIHRIEGALATGSRAGLGRPEALLRLREFQDVLVRLTLDRAVEYFRRMRVLGVAQGFTLAHE